MNTFKSDLFFKKVKILFICKASIQDGIGHLHRTKHVAEKAKQHADVKIFIIGDDMLSSIFNISTIEFEFYTGEVDVIKDTERYGPDIIFLDMLTLTYDVFRFFRRFKLLVGLSPVFNRINNMDLFFNRSSYLPEYLLNELGKVKLYCNFKYAVIDDRVQRIPFDMYQENLGKPSLSIVISMGGTDASNKTLNILQAIRQVKNPLLVWVLLGEGYEYSYQELVNCMNKSGHEIILAKTNSSMWEILKMCSILISAGGITTYEAVYAGLPSINLFDLKKRKFLLKELERKKVCICLDVDFKKELTDLIELIEGLFDFRDALLKMHMNTRNLLDQKGGERIVLESIRYLKKHFVF